MANQRKEALCQLMASLFSPPDHEMVKQIRLGTLFSFLQENIHLRGEDADLLRGFRMEGDPEILLKGLEIEYERLFSGLSEESISLVESFYKPWTQDSSCSLSFASSKGHLMGDSALHLMELYRQCHLEATGEFRGFPDHLVLELEFLSHLYRWATDIEIRKFIEDHLDWIPLLKEEVKRVHPHPYYDSLLEVLDLFLTEERERLEMEKNEQKGIR